MLGRFPRQDFVDWYNIHLSGKCYDILYYFYQQMSSENELKVMGCGLSECTSHELGS